MLEFKEKKKIKKLMYSQPVLLALLVIFLLSFEGLWDIYRKHSEAFEKSQEAKADLENLRSRKTELEKRVAFLKTDRGKEEEIRKKFMVGKQGEGVILVVDSTPSTTLPLVAPSPSFWAGFLDFFR